MGCNCNEGKPYEAKNGTILIPPNVHDCAYVKAREALIPEAQELARVRTSIQGPGYWFRRNKEFHRAMEELAASRLHGNRTGQ